ncbi:MAG: hypothetical protein HRT57_00395 [Crocinitomicaceae bacterium]|nr:hypothetical protein [Crocinitomicaceae bacterium]
MNKLIYYIIPINLILDVLLIVTKNVAFFKAALMTALLAHLMIRYTGKHKPYSWVFVWGFYALTISLISSDVEASFLNTLKIVIPIFTILIGYHFFNTKEKIKYLAKSMKAVLLIVIINLVLSTIFGLGSSRYTEEGEEETFYMGQLSDHWNMFTYAILSVPILLHYETKKGKIYVSILAFLNAILILLSIKRIALAGLIGGGLINAFMTLKTKVILKFTFIGALVMIVSYPIYGGMLSERFEARSDRFEEGSLEKESRLLETSYVWGDAFSFEPLDKSLFGMEAFNSAGTYAGGIFGDRQLHVDYNNILNTIGIVGLALYFIMFIQIWKSFKRTLKGLVIQDKFSKSMKSIFYTFFIMQFVTSIAGQMYNITFRMILFIFLGAAMGYFNELKKQQFESSNN